MSASAVSSSAQQGRNSEIAALLKKNGIYSTQVFQKSAVDGFLASIREAESNNNYHAVSTKPGSTASGAYKFTNDTWEQFRGASMAESAKEASKEEQDAAATRAAENYFSDFHNWLDSARAWRKGYICAKTDNSAGEKYAIEIIRNIPL